MPEGWEDRWKPMEEGVLRGAQGSVTKVVRTTDGAIGALKRLHSEHLERTERRHRMKQEVDALKLLEGQGTPIVLEDNTERWQDPGGPLYAVFGWVEGCRLTDYTRGEPVALDEALTIVRALCTIIERCHESGILHRDIKPDNIVLANCDPTKPVLVDFGLSWSQPDEDAPESFQTDSGQELGNRFLRLPEHAPGHHVRDPGSDVTVLVGTLFYLVSGRAPRVLLDQEGRMPHERDEPAVPQGLTSDPRWPRLRRVFRVGFQYLLSDRFQTADQLRQALVEIDSMPEEEADRADVALERISELLESQAARRHRKLQESIRAASEAFLAAVAEGVQERGLEIGQSGPNFNVGGLGASLHLTIRRRGIADPEARLRHQIWIEQDIVIAGYSLEGDQLKEYYRGHATDSETLKEQAAKAGRSARAALAERLLESLSQVLQGDA